MKNNQIICVLAFAGFFTLIGCGSQSSDIPSFEDVDNPLPPCPNSPNCIRITRQINQSSNTVFNASLETIRAMNPEEITMLEDQQEIKSVFKVLLFRDDMVLQFTEADSNSTYLHIRSSSRVGESDLGVNTRRVRSFLKKLQSNLPND